MQQCAGVTVTPTLADKIIARANLACKKTISAPASRMGTEKYT
jgi:hypothetical protein